MSNDVQFVRVPYELVDNPAIHSDAELGLIVRLARKAEWKVKKETLKDGSQCMLAPGEMVIAEREVAESAGIHRTTVRRLFERLERAGLCVRRCANQRSSNGTILSWTFLQVNQQVDDGCKTEVKPSSQPSCVQTSADVEPSINMDIDTRFQITDSLRAPSHVAEASGGVGKADGNLIGSANLEDDEPSLFGPDGDIADPALREQIREAEQKTPTVKRRKSCLDTAAALRDPCRPFFLKFYYEAMPKRDDGSDLKRSWNAFRAAVASGVPAERIVEGAEAYKACMIRKGACAEDGTALSDFIKAAQNWLSNEEPQWDKYITLWEKLKNQPVGNVHPVNFRNNQPFRQQPQHKAAPGVGY